MPYKEVGSTIYMDDDQATIDAVTARLSTKRTIMLRLLTTYDATVLSDASEAERAEIVAEISDNPVLMELVRNWMRGGQPITPAISGPQTLTEQVDPNSQRRVYVFGELHGRDGECSQDKYMEARYYFRRLFTTTSAFIDFFLEIPSYTGTSWSKVFMENIRDGRQGDIMKDIRGALVKCTSAAHRDAKDCQLIRAHFTDVRFDNHAATNTLSYLALLSTMTPGRIRMGLAAPDVRQLLADLVKDPGHVIETYVLSGKFTKKALLQLNPEIQESIRDYVAVSLKSEFEAREKLYGSGGRTLQHLALLMYNTDLNTVSDDKMVRLLKYINNAYLTPLESWVVDAYTMARLFKTFAASGDQPTEARNAIVYAGEAHAERLRVFLTRVGFSMVGKAGIKTQTSLVPPDFIRTPRNDAVENDGFERCLNMTGISQPLF